MKVRSTILFLLIILNVGNIYSKPPKENVRPKPYNFDTLGYAKNLVDIINLFNFCKSDTNGVYERVIDDSLKTQSSARYPGGYEYLNKFISYNIRYPSVSRENMIEGKVVVKFIINEDGQICNLQILKIGGYGLPEEVIRLVKTMPKWLPARIKGIPVKSYWILPVSFKIA